MALGIIIVQNVSIDVMKVQSQECFLEEFEKESVVKMLLKTGVEWHDLRIDDEDLPGEGEPVIVTIESVSGERLVWHDVYFKYNDFREPCWCTAALNEYGWPEETVVWYPVIAWAYYPEPYYI